MNDSNNKIQIVAFSTNEKTETPNDILTTFLSFYTHKMIKKTKTTLAFNIVFPDSNTETKIMICSILNLTKDYSGITDVNCYILVVHLEKEDAQAKLEEILQYMKEYCDETKKIFIIGLSSSSSTAPTQTITQKEITNQMDNFGQKYEYHNMKLTQPKEVAEYILQIFMYSKNHLIHQEGEDEADLKDGGQSHSCTII